MNIEWTEPKLLALISDQIEESDQLEYKGAGALKKADRERDEICKDVSSFANAGGGTIIYGINEFNDALRKHLPEKLDPIDRTIFTREWLEQIINNIEPRIPNLKILPVPLSSNAQHVAYVVDIPKGETAHQAPNGRYYRRYNFEALFMKDHEVRDVMNRKRQPTVKSNVVINAISPDPEKKSCLSWEAENLSDVFCQHVAAQIFVPLMIDDVYFNFDQGYVESNSEDQLYWVLKPSNDINHPLFPRSTFHQKLPLKHHSRITLTDLLKKRMARSISEVHVWTYADSAAPVLQMIQATEVFRIVDEFGNPL